LERKKLRIEEKIEKTGIASFGAWRGVGGVCKDPKKGEALTTPWEDGMGFHTH
jgi:hypothetical protein